MEKIGVKQKKTLVPEGKKVDHTKPVDQEQGETSYDLLKQKAIAFLKKRKKKKKVRGARTRRRKSVGRAITGVN